MDIETQEIRQARQKASVKWLLSKAFNNRVPDNLKEPFYRDHENQERLKPQIIVEMGNATLYCQTLSNLYSDPNYQSLNHWSIIQTLARKGVPVAESPDMPLTETVLIQTNPLRINAHMSVIESLMILYAKEISSGDRIPHAVRRISGSNLPTVPGQHFEQSLLSWISHVCAALKKRIAQDVESGATDETGVRLQAPDIPPVRDFQDLCDGVCLALLISYYCPKVIPWTSVRINYLPAVEDSIHNVLLVSNFSQKHLPYSVFHMTPEDITYMRGSMKQNLIVLLADLFNLFEIHPAKCVCYPGMETQVTRSASATVITRRPTPPKEYQTVEHNNYSTNNDEGFVVHKTRGITTLSSMHNQEPLVPARLRQAKEKNNVETKADERGDYVPAGRPSNWEQNRRPSYAGRRSRRNSSSEDSQLTIENFGGSQDQLNMIGRGFERDREREREKERKLSNVSVEPAVAVRSSIADARGTLQLGYDTDSGSEKQDRETEKNLMRRQGSVDNISLRNIKHSNEKDFADADLSSHSNFNNSKPSAYNTSIAAEEETTPKRKTSFAALPTNTTTWQQQSALLNQSGDPNDPYLEEDSRPLVDATKLTHVRMKLEEKRRRIEQEKRKIEVALSKHQEKVGKAAFLQAINKDDIESSLDSMKWETLSNESKRTPDIDPIDLEKYQQSIATMNLNLQDIQQDIHRLATQQSQIQAQHLQAQQLIQAQQIANMLHQQPYGSQQHIPGQYQRQPIQQGFGSTPHIPQAYNSPSAYNSRPPSRDPYQQQQQQQQQQPQPIQYINEHGQYITQHPVSMQPQNQSPYMQQPQNQPASLYSRGGVDMGVAVGQYENGGYNQYGSTQQMHHPQYPIEQNQYQSHQQYISRPPEYDDYPPPHRGRDPNSPQSNQFYLHESSPQPTQRRTWAQSAAAHHEQQQQQYQPQPMQLVDVNAWQSQTMSPKVVDARTWKSSTPSTNSQSSSGSGGGFMLHQNGGNDYGHQEKSYQNLFPVHSSPQHRQTPPRSMMGNHRESRQMKSSPAPPPQDDMAPQSICFIGDDDDVVDQNEMHIETMPSRKLSEVNHSMRPMHGDYENDISLSKLNITSGSLTYRIPSPSRPSLNANSFQDPQEDQTIEKGFYISFDDDQPKRPKPPLRAKRSPKKEKSLDSVDRGQLQNNYDRNELQRNNSFENNKATYNKYTDAPIQLRQLTENQALNTMDRRHLEDVTNQQQQQQQQSQNVTQQQQQPQQHSLISLSRLSEPKENKALVIGTELSNLDPESVDEMERRKEKIMLLSLQRRQQQEEAKARKEIESMQRREKEREKEDERARKKEEQMARRAAILEQHRLKKAIEEAEREGKTLDRSDMLLQKHLASQQQQSPAAPRLRTQKATRPRPKTIHVETGSVDISEASSLASSRGKKGSSTNLTGYGQLSSNSMRRDFYRGSQDSLAVKEKQQNKQTVGLFPEPTVERGRTMSRISVAKGSTLNFRGRKSNSLMNLCDSGLGRATPPRRAPSPGMGPSGRHLPSPSGPGSLPPGLVSKRRVFDDGSSDISSSNPISMMEYSGPKLYKQPAAKSNRGIILNAVEYCVFPGAVNRDAKQKVLEKIARSEAKHFLILFRDAGCQFRALYSYVPENEQIFKLYGTGPSQVDEVMFDKFFKYNSGGKCFSQVHTKHLTVTIDAFTIHNSLWQGKKVHLPSKKDMALVI